LHPKHIQPVIFKESLLISAKDKWLYLYFGTQGIFFGILLFIFLVTIGQYFNYRDVTFLLFALYVLSFFLLCLRQFSLENGYFQLLPDWAFLQTAHTPFILPIYFFYALFGIVFLQTERYFPRLDKILRGVLVIMLVYFLAERIAIYGVGQNLAYRMDKIFRPFLLSVFLVMLVPVLRSSNKLTRLFGAGTLCIVLLTLVGSLLTYGNVPQTWRGWDVAYSFSQIGLVLQLLILSMALGYKAKLIEEEKNRAQVNLQLKQQESENLKELNQLKSRFFTNITHEFRTPLTVIRGLAQEIQKNPKKDLEKRTGLIQSNADNILQLVNQLLDLSKVEARQFQVNYTQLEIVKYLSYLTNAFQATAIDQKITLSFHALMDELWMDADSNIMKTIASNLIGNALKFTPSYGHVQLTVETVARDILKTVFNPESHSNERIVGLDGQSEIFENTGTTNFLKWTIKDTGSGIASDALPHIFDRFYRADKAGLLQKEGTGVGLALVKEMVELLDGFIHVRSEEQNGSTFTVFLPIRKEASKAVPIVNKTDIARIGEANSDILYKSIPSEAISSPTQETLTEPLPVLLVVEDNADVCYYLRSYLQDNYQILDARNGKEGCEMAIAHVPDLILSDVMMPEMDGYELCEQLRKDVRTSHIPIVFLTAKVTEADRQEGFAKGAVAYLTKPFDERTLQLQLDNFLQFKKQLQLNLTLLPNSHGGQVTNQEAQFLQRLNMTIKENAQNELFRAPHLARAMAMSSTQLYRKLKALTNQSTAQYIKAVRLRMAKTMLQTTNFSIGQIAAEVGFKTQAHFTRAFSEQFGKTPSEMRK
ncbi:MAG: response regulator, partial [Bacteroidota bacterium]